MRTALVAPLALLALTGCATLPEPAGGESGLPNAGAGPFRALINGEMGEGRIAPNALGDSHSFARDIAVVDLDGDPKTLEVAGYVAAGVKENGAWPPSDGPTKSIQRFGALDGRSFDRAAAEVLAPDADWEGGVVGAPSAVRKGGEIWLYYAAAGGIGLARGDAQGLTFTKAEGPVLGPDAAGWEGGAAPRSPGAVVLADGSVRLFYEVPLPTGSVIGEARSDDGLRFERVGAGPALDRGVDSGDAGEVAYDGAGVGAPAPLLAKGATGETILRVYYGALDAAGTRTIGLAARYGVDEPLQRAVSPVFGTSKPLGPSEPCVVPFDGFTLLFATQRSSVSNGDPVVAAGVAPATATLPAPALP